MSRQPHERTRAWVEVDLDALRRNAAALAARAGVPLLPMIKADGYGLGAVRVAHALESLDPWGFGVATVAEGEQLRAGNVKRPIVVFTAILGVDFERAHRARLTPALGSRESIERWAAIAQNAAWHLAIDTGMSRSGARWDSVGDLRDTLARHPPEGAFTHFHSAERNDGSMEIQDQRFAEAVAKLGVRPRLLHTSNSAAIARQERSRYDLVRPGVFLFGGGVGVAAALVPEPVAHLRAPVVEVRDLNDGDTVSYGATFRAAGQRRIATVAVGYADGYRRALGNQATALLGQKRVPVVGVVTMDMTLLDVTGLACTPGDVVTLLGRDSAGGRGKDTHIALDDLAAQANTISYELLVGLKLRAERVYLDGAA
jgi:alanine racemase